MADSTTHLDQINFAQAGQATTANALFDALSLAAVFGRRASTTGGLIWGFYGGRVNGTFYANGTVTATASNTNYVVVHRTTYTVSIDTATTNWDDTTTYGRAYLLTVGAAAITDYEDHRFSNDGSGIFDLGSGTGGSVPTGTGFRHVTSGTEDGTAVAVDLASDVTGTLPNANLDDMANATIKGRTTAGTGVPEDLTAAQVAAILGTNVKSTESIIIACTDETTSISAATGKVTFRMPYAFTLTDIRASLTTAQATGSTFTVDVNEAGTTIISTKLTIDNTEKTSTTAAAAAVISDASLADDAEMTVDVDQIGDGTATGLKITLIGHRA